MSIDKNRVIIFDTTLRDGEQSPGATMNLEEKLLIAEALDKMGVDVIEAGFAVASNGDFEAVNQIAKKVKNASVCSLARARMLDIEKAAEAIKSAARKRIHTFISTSPLHMKYKLNMEPSQVLEAIADSVSYARNFVDDVEWSCEDGSRTERDFLYKSIETAIKAGATTINIPDTVGYTIPDEYADIITSVLNNVSNIDKAIISVHCHNDLGLAVANSLAAVKAGARQIECTINGLGERAGNAAMEELVMAMKTRHDLLPFSNNIDATHITRISRLVSTITGFAVQNNKAIVGANAFAHESGIHQDGMLKHAGTYEIMTPESVGLNKSTLVMGKHSGRHAFKKKLEELGIDTAEIEEAFLRFKDLADKKKEVYDEDIIALFDDSYIDRQNKIKFISLKIRSDSRSGGVAEIELEIDGAKNLAETTGEGPVDATFNAICELVPHNSLLKLYQVHAVTQGTDAQAEVSVRLAQGKEQVTGHGSDTDTLVASAKAYINALNKMIAAEGKIREKSSFGDV